MSGNSYSKVGDIRCTPRHHPTSGQRAVIDHVPTVLNASLDERKDSSSKLRQSYCERTDSHSAADTFSTSSNSTPRTRAQCGRLAKLLPRPNPHDKLATSPAGSAAPRQLTPSSASCGPARPRRPRHPGRCSPRPRPRPQNPTRSRPGRWQRTPGAR